jgi:hypothetical protein
MNTFFGIPAHPLVVHVPAMLIPLAAIGVIVMVVRPTWWERYKWATLGVAGVGMLGAILAAGSGESLEEAVEGTASRSMLHDHAEAGEAARTVSIVFFVVLLAAIVVMPWIVRRRATAGGASGSGSSVVGTPTWLRTAVSLVLVITALGASWSVYDAGHSGAKSVWSEVKVGEGGEDRGEGRGDDD